MNFGKKQGIDILINLPSEVVGEAEEMAKSQGFDSAKNMLVIFLKRQIINYRRGKLEEKYSDLDQIK